MIDHVEIGAAPCDEPCAQLGEDGYSSRARAECARFIEAIRAALGPEPGSARLYVRSCPHDFGSYYEVACRYDDQDEEAAAYAWRCQEESPRRWPAEPVPS